MTAAAFGALAAGIWAGLVIFAVWFFRWAGKRRGDGDRLAQSPVPGTPSQAPPTEAAAQDGRLRAPAPAHRNFGPERLTVHIHDTGMIIDNHVLRTRRVIPARAETENDTAYLARLEQEMKRP